MPYLEVAQGNQDEIELKNEITVPDITGKTVEEAEKILQEYKLNIYINNETEYLDKENTIVKVQTPKQGITVFEDSYVYVDV